jgi:hypothetical protein
VSAKVEPLTSPIIFSGVLVFLERTSFDSATDFLATHASIAA